MDDYFSVENCKAREEYFLALRVYEASLSTKIILGLVPWDEQ